MCKRFLKYKKNICKNASIVRFLKDISLRFKNEIRWIACSLRKRCLEWFVTVIGHLRISSIGETDWMTGDHIKMCWKSLVIILSLWAKEDLIGWTLQSININTLFFKFMSNYKKILKMIHYSLASKKKKLRSGTTF